MQKAIKLFSAEADAEKTAKFTVKIIENTDYSAKLKSYRKKHKMTQEELADVLSVKHSTLRCWEQKLSKPPYHVWSRYRHLFDSNDK